MIQRYLILIVCALAHLSAYAEGFLAGTLVKTPFGYTEIEQLKIGDKVVCYDFMGKCVTRKVTHVQQEEVDTYAQITIGNEQVFAALDHKFYVPNDNAWLEAHKIKPGSVLLKRCTEYIPVDSVEVIEASTVVYDITVDELHNFCVTTEDVCVHNVVPFVAGVTFTWAFGGGLVPAVSGLFALGAFAIQAVFKGAFVPRTVDLDFDADKFGERFGSRPPCIKAEKEDKDDKNGKGGKEDKGGKKPEAESSTKPTTRPKPGEQAKPGRPTKEDGFEPPRSWSGEKERHPKTG